MNVRYQITLVVGWVNHVNGLIKLENEHDA